jgi:ribosome-associated heat shock protein Hsp15
VKTRSLAAALVSRGKLRVNRIKIFKPSHPVGPGDVLTIALSGGVRVLKVVDAGSRRGPASQARLLYDDLSPPDPPAAGEPGAPEG